MNIEAIKVLLGIAGKFVPVIKAVLGEIGPALVTLGPDTSQLITDANKLLMDLESIFNALKTNVVKAATNTTTTVVP